MSSVEFRGTVYSAMKKAEEERKASQGGKLGGHGVSDTYLDGLNSGGSSRPQRKYDISGSWISENNSPSKDKKS